MKYSFLSLILVILFSNTLLANNLKGLDDVVTIKDAVVSCIRIIETNEDPYGNPDNFEIELYFWNKDNSDQAKKLFKDGFKLADSIEEHCESPTPIVDVIVPSRNFLYIDDAIIRAINLYYLTPEDGQKIWVIDINFK